MFIHFVLISVFIGGTAAYIISMLWPHSTLKRIDHVVIGACGGFLGMFILSLLELGYAGALIGGGFGGGVFCWRFRKAKYSRHVK